MTEAVTSLDEARQRRGLEPDTLTDDGNATLFADLHADWYRYVPEWGAWLVWDGYRWRRDGAESVVYAARQMARNLAVTSAAAVKHRDYSLSLRGIQATVRAARTDPRLIVSASKLDAHPRLLCTPGGTVDLETGELSHPDPDELHTRVTEVTPNFHMSTPRWDAFLDQIFDGDHELVGYMRRLAGYSVTGETGHHVLPFLFGKGRNGKGVLKEVVVRLLADYASTLPSNFLVKGPQQHPTELARLQGLRLVVGSEVPPGSVLDESKTKELTGGDAITARFMSQDFFTFTATHHLWLVGNHLPDVTSGGYSLWQRMRLIQFPHSFEGKDQDPNLIDRLIHEEGPGILAWMIRGAIEVLGGSGLQEPASVVEATENYAAEEDLLTRFLDSEDVVVGITERVETKRFRANYEAWCYSEGERPLRGKTLAKELRTKHGITTQRSNGRYYYLGVGITTTLD